MYIPFYIAIGVLVAIVCILIVYLVKLQKRVSIANAAAESCAQDAQEYQKAILYNAYSYYRVNLTRNVLIPPVIEREFGELKDVSSTTTYQYDILVSERAEQLVTEAFRDDFVFFFSPSNLLKCYNEGKMNVSYTCKCHTPQLGIHNRKFVFYLSKDRKSDDVMSIVVAYEC